MKKSTTNSKEPNALLIIVLMLVAMVFNCFKSYSQPFLEYTKKYANTYAGGLAFTDNVVVEPFSNTSVNPPVNGFVIFQTEYNATNMSNLIVHRIDDAGTITLTRRFDLNVSGVPLVAQDHMVPVAAAYNPATFQYIVVGNGRNMNNNSRINPWYLVLDQGLNMVTAGAIDLISTTGIGAVDNNSMVTDVCAVQGINNISWAMVGTILDNTIDASPKLPSAFNKRMFISTLSNTYVANSMEYQFSIGATQVDRHYFPSRIIQVPTATFGGFIVTGTGANHPNFAPPLDAKGFFYFRTDYTLAPSGFVSLDNPISLVDFFAGGNLRYDIGSDDILVSGTLNGNSSAGPAFFFDKILDVSTTASINTFSTTAAWWNNNLGIKRLPTSLSGFAKSGNIAESTTNNGNIVLGKLYNNNISLTLPVALECRYGDNDLNNWMTNQTANLEYYWRYTNNIAPNQYYDGYNWDEIWYPCHSSAEYPFAAYGSYQYGMAGLDDDMGITTVAMNFTDGGYNNVCNRTTTTVALDVIPIESIGNVSVTNQAPIQVQYAPPINAITPAIPAETDCLFTQFKTTGNNNFTESEKGNYTIIEKGKSFEVIGNYANNTYKLFDIYGSVVQKGSIENNTVVINTYYLPKGLYIVQILDQYHRQVNAIKFVQK